MQIVAVIAVRNEEAYMANLLRHLIENGITFAIIDNGSTDSTLKIVTSAEFQSHLIAISHLPFNDAFDLNLQLREKMALINSIDADWVIHLDADEILHSYHDGESLREAITRTDAAGFNVIDFNEFVFLPVEVDYEPNRQGLQPIRHYYFFEPTTPHRMKAWKKAAGLSMIETGGHKLLGCDIRLSPEKMVMRHYMFCNQNHAFKKYTDRQFALHDLARGWHRSRFDQREECFRFPPIDRLCVLENAHSRNFDRSRPVRQHFWRWEF